MSRPVRVVARRDPTSGGAAGATAPSADVTGLMRALDAALDGSGPAVLASADAHPSPSLAASVATAVPQATALVVRTSGSTGTPRGVLLSADALRASATATAARLGGHGRWLLALPTDHIAGLQVLVRSVLAGTRPVVVHPGPFRAQAFVAATAELVATFDGPGGPGGAPERRYTSLVPTQLRRLLADPEAVLALREFDAVLLGGAAAAPALVDAARAADVRVVTTYGMSETCGGCVYDGVPLDGVGVDLEPDGRVLLSGPVLATGYLGRPDLDAAAFVDRAGVRWLRTSDAGALDAGPHHGAVLTILGRLDDVIVSGGVKIAPTAVEGILADVVGIAEVCVVGTPDAEWGQAVTAVVVLAAGTQPPVLNDLRSAVTRTLGPAAAPRNVVVVDSLPLRGPGKTDRSAVSTIAIASIGSSAPTVGRSRAAGSSAPTP